MRVWQVGEGVKMGGEGVCVWAGGWEGVLGSIQRTCPKSSRRDEQLYYMRLSHCTFPIALATLLSL